MTATVSEPKTKDLAVHKARATRVSNTIEKMTIASEEDYSKAGDYLLEIRKARKEVVEKKRGILDPINLAAKRTREFFKPVEIMLDQAQGKAERAMLDYRRQAEAEEKAKEAELEEKMDRGEITIDEAIGEAEKVQQPAKTVYGARGRTTVRVTEDVEVDLTELPREYMLPDMVKIRDHALGRSGHDRRNIPGVKIVQREAIV